MNLFRSVCPRKISLPKMKPLLPTKRRKGFRLVCVRKMSLPKMTPPFQNKTWTGFTQVYNPTLYVNTDTHLLITL